MIALREVKQQMLLDPKHWALYLMDFVDDFRYHKNPQVIVEPLPYTDPRLDPLLASTVESLCDELGMESPSWLADVPACATPWFVSGVENLKAIALAESPLRFRIRKIFVLNNFLSRA